MLAAAKELPIEWFAIGILIACAILAPLLLGYGLGKEKGKDEERRKNGKHSKSQRAPGL